MDNRFLQMRQALSAVYDAREAHALALLVLDEVFGVSAVDVYADKVRNFSEEEHGRLENILQRLCNSEPVQYVLGYADFCGLRFAVSPATLIPRPETEELVDWVVAESAEKPCRLLDVGTGSGCIAIALAHRLPQAAVEAWDVSEDALAVARKNAESHGVDVAFTCCNLLAEPPAEGAFDVIVSNPPYICESEQADMEAHVLRHEPHLALFVPNDDPLRFYRALALLGKRSLIEGGSIFMEINQAYGAETAALFEAMGYRTELRRDFFQKDRMLRATLSAR